MNDSWNWKDFEELAQVHMGRQEPPSAASAQVKAFIDEAFSHYEEAMPDGKAYVDKLLLNTVMFLESKLKELPDTAEVRQMRRAIGLKKGKHLSAQLLVDRFPLLRESDARISEGTGILCATLQRLLDLLHDATQGLQDGAAKVSMLGLAYWLIDELIVAQLLARRGHATLAYSNLRNLHETHETFTKPCPRNFVHEIPKVSQSPNKEWCSIIFICLDPIAQTDHRAFPKNEDSQLHILLYG